MIARGARSYRGLSGYSATALQAATGQWGGTPGQQWSSMWTPTTLWEAYAPGSTPYIAAQETLQAICGSNPGDPPLPAGNTFSAGGMTTVGIQNECNPPTAPNAGETGAAYRTRQMNYTASSMSPTDASTYIAAATKQAAISDAYAAAHPPGSPVPPVDPNVLKAVAAANPWPNVSGNIATGGGGQPNPPQQQSGTTTGGSTSPGSTNNSNVTGQPAPFDYTTLLIIGAVVGVAAIFLLPMITGGK